MSRVNTVQCDVCGIIKDISQCHRDPITGITMKIYYTAKNPDHAKIKQTCSGIDVCVECLKKLQSELGQTFNRFFSQKRVPSDAS